MTDASDATSRQDRRDPAGPSATGAPPDRGAVPAGAPTDVEGPADDVELPGGGGVEVPPGSRPPEGDATDGTPAEEEGSGGTGSEGETTVGRLRGSGVGVEDPNIVGDVGPTDVAPGADPDGGLVVAEDDDDDRHSPPQV